MRFDGNLDIVATDLPGGLSGGRATSSATPGGNVSVFLGNGAGSFSDHKDSDGGGDFPGAVTVGDFNGDGKLGVAVTNFSTRSFRAAGHGDGSFGQATNSPIHRPSPDCRGSRDFNQDGKLDIAVANAETTTSSFFLAR
jgi:hypothetical protein